LAQRAVETGSLSQTVAPGSIAFDAVLGGGLASAGKLVAGIPVVKAGIAAARQGLGRAGAAIRAGMGRMGAGSGAARGVGAAEEAGVTGRRFIVDPKGNALIEPPGGAAVGNPAGTFVETRYPNGSPYQQLHSPRGQAPHGHGFLEGAGPNQRGPSLDVYGNVVPENAPAAHWPVNE
jgi:hypothetical protein